MNRFNQIFHDVLENLASQELNSRYFREKPPRSFTEGREAGIQEFRKSRVDAILKEAREITRTLMDTGAENIEDVKFRKLLTMERKFSMKVIDKAMEELKDKLGDIEYDDLNYNQLLLLESKLEHDKFMDNLYN